MDIKIIYTNQYEIIEKFQNDNTSYYILMSDNWNDYGYVTTFNVKIIKNKEIYDDFRLKLAFKNQNSNNSSSSILNSLLEDSGQVILDFEDLIESHEFISISDHYEELKEIFEEQEEFKYILKHLNDILYLKEFNNESNLIDITSEEIFEVSLLRDQYYKKLYHEGYNSIISNALLNADTYFFDFNYKLGDREYNYLFDFRHEKLPSRINVLIGKNGVGKTKTLEELVDYFINPQTSSIQPKYKPMFLSNLMVFSYNPYDDFYIYKKYDNISIEYQYLGFRRYKNIDDGIDINVINDYETINSLNILNTKEYQDKLLFINSLEPLEQKRELDNFIDKIHNSSQLNKTIITKSINIALDTFSKITSDFKNNDKLSFNSMLDLTIKDEKKSKYSKKTPLIQQILHFISSSIEKIENISLIKINGEKLIYDGIYSWHNINEEEFHKEVFFLDDDDKIIPLSSGQKVYTHLIINLIAKVKENSLIIIDEPENTLHPNFEIGFINILNTILTEYNSFAIVATHSTIIAREVPSEFINIIIEKDNVIEIQKPAMKTFGASTSDITNYIFDDIFSSNKYHSGWLKNVIGEKYLGKFKSFDDFKNDFSDLLSYELMLEAKKIFKSI